MWGDPRTSWEEFEEEEWVRAESERDCLVTDTTQLYCLADGSGKRGLWKTKLPVEE